MKKGKLRFQIASWLIEHSRDCYFCKGRGHLYGTKRIDSITTMDTSEECPVCSGYGKYPLNFITKFFIKLIPEE